MVRDVVCPREHWLADMNAGKDFLTSLIEFEIKVAANEVASGDKISEAVRQRARAKARTRASTRAVIGARARNETVGTVVNSKYNFTAIAHIARSEDTNAQIVELGWYTRRMVQWLAFRTGARG